MHRAVFTMIICSQFLHIPFFALLHEGIEAQYDESGVDHKFQ